MNSLSIAKSILMVGSGIALAACSDKADNSQIVDAQPVANDSQVETVALGLTLYQLADAELIGAKGQELGEVERVVRNSSNTVTGLIIEIEDSNPDRYVEISLEGQTAMRERNDSDDYLLQSDLTRDQLVTLPDVRR